MMLTIFTPTYNRGHFLFRLHENLLSQSERDFEWLIVDDGSTDDTASVVAELISSSPLEIRYVRKDNGGKHTAHNTAISLASGEWFLCLDSDDVLTNNALAHIRAAILSASLQDCGIISYKSLPDGQILSSPFPGSDLRYSLYEHSVLGGGEYALVFRTSIIKRFPFPVIAGERFSTECVVYDRLSLEHQTFFALPEVLEICEYQPDGLSSNAYRLLLQNPTGYQIYHAQRIDLVHTWKLRLRHAICYQAFCRLSRNRDYRYRGKHRFLTALAWLPGQLGAMYYKKKGT